MSGISTHVLDTSLGRPAAGITVAAEMQTDSGWQQVGTGTTDADGRVAALVSSLNAANYRLIFRTAAYFRTHGKETFYPEITVVFTVQNPQQRYHVPLLLSPFGYSTYRGS